MDDLNLAASWCAPAPAAWVEVVWTNRGRVPLALWPMTDTDTGPQHDALQIEAGDWSAALIAPRKHAAARWCALAPGQQHAVRIDLAAWQRQLLAPEQPQSAWQLAYSVKPGQSGLPASLPACGSGSAQPVQTASAAVWVGRVVAAITPAVAGDSPNDGPRNGPARCRKLSAWP